MGILYLVPTPVGNLEDITYRALRILKEADLILAEDTRTTGILLKHFEIKNAMLSYHKFNEHQTVSSVVSRLNAGETVAVVSDAGTPGISDPGFLVAREAVKAGVEVICLPGATAFVPALVASGLPCDRFCFEGFLPVKKGRATRLAALSSESRTLVFYESPHRHGTGRMGQELQFVQIFVRLAFVLRLRNQTDQDRRFGLCVGNHKFFHSKNFLYSVTKIHKTPLENK